MSFISCLFGFHLIFQNCPSIGCELSIRVLEERKLIFQHEEFNYEHVVSKLKTMVFFHFRLRMNKRYFDCGLRKSVPVFLGWPSFLALLVKFALQIMSTRCPRSLFFVFFFFSDNLCCSIHLVSNFLQVSYCTCSMIPTLGLQFKKKYFLSF